jgi:signal transduction histidine kinase
MLEKADERRVTLNIEAAPDLPRLSLDRDAWKQVFLNLIDNGIKYGKEGGHVNMRLSHTPNEATITVTDDGPGIAPEDQPHIFEEAYRAGVPTKEAGGDVSGSGLGLAIVRRIVEQHGGSISCESALGKGTTFAIILPLEQNVTIR